MQRRLVNRDVQQHSFQPDEPDFIAFERPANWNLRPATFYNHIGYYSSDLGGGVF